MVVSTMVEEGADERIPIYIGETLLTEISVYYRPFMHEFLKDMARKFEIIIYSSLNSSYVRTIIDRVQKDYNYFEYCLCEEFCAFSNFSYGVKCLEILLGNRDKKDIIFVDTTVKSLPFDPNNLIPIPSYSHKAGFDRELINLAAILDEISQSPNIPNTLFQFIETAKAPKESK
jgi:TFIIF-interacting CTD phosphatase-like protein